MFNIRSLVNRISQVKDGEAAENSSSNRNRSQSQISGTSVDGAIPVEAEGFLCPSCMAAFSSPDDLQNHYQTDHLDPGANYLCPVCKARLVTAEELELHFSTNHAVASVNSGDVEKLVKQIGELTSSLTEEKWHTKELRKELENVKEIVQAQGTSDEQKMYQQQLHGLQETKSLLTSEVVLLRKQLTESLASVVQLKQDKERIETKAAGYSQLVAELQANLDDNNSHIAGLKENIQDLQLQLSQISTNEDADAQIKELSSAQKLAEEVIASKDQELADLQKKLTESQLQSETHQIIASSEEATLKNSFEERISELESKNKNLESEAKQQLAEVEKLSQLLSEKTDQLQSLQHIREETDVCVGHLREEVTALQDMLSEARHQAEGQVSAKDDELFKFKQDFLKQEKQVMQLEEQCQGLNRTNENLTKDLAQQRQLTEDRDQALERMKEEINQLGEKVSRLESEKLELSDTIQKGEGMIDTVIQQLKQENERLQDELSRTKASLTSVEHQAKTNSAEWSRTEQQLKEERKQLEEKFANLGAEWQKSLENVSSLKEAIQSKDGDLKNWHEKFGQCEKAKLELESLSQQQSKQLEESSQQKAVAQKELDSEKEKNAALSKANENLQRSVEESEKQIGELRTKCDHLSKVTQDLDGVRKELEESKEKSASLNSIKENLEEQLKHDALRLESLEKTCHDRDGEISTLNFILQESQSRIGDLEKSVTEKDRVLSQQKVRIDELEPLTEALEQEKMRRIKEKAEWGEHEQLLRGEKEALSTSVSHLQQQLDELTKEHQFHLQRLKTEGDSLLKEKNTLTEQLNTERERRAKDLEEWQSKGSKLDEEVKTLFTKLRSAEDLSAARYQRCEELQTSSEKYLSLKIELEAKVAVLEEEKLELQNNCSQWETEVDRLKFNAVELRRRLEDSQAALHELGRENQSLQMENAKLMGRKWADDSEVNDCHNCHKGFNLTVRKHHCRNCGQIFCNECSSKAAAVGNSRKPVRVCDSCFKELNINPTR